MPKSYCCLLLLACVFLCVQGAFGVEPPVSWFGEGWKYRQVIVRDPGSISTELEHGSVRIATAGEAQQNGADIRVTDLSNNPVPFTVVEVSKEGMVLVEFDRPENPGASEAYCVYYGNPDCGPLSTGMPDLSAGGVKLTAKRYKSGDVRTYDEFMACFNAAEKTMGQGRRDLINDDSTPFTEGFPRVLVTYDAVLWAPQDGIYGFQFKASGAGFLLLDGGVVLEQELNTGRFSTVDSVRLTKGYHTMRFVVYSRHPSSYIAELYWRLPGKSSFEIIPSNAYAQTTFFVPVMRQRSGQIVSSFFTHSVQKKLRLVTTDNVLSLVQFRALASNSLRKPALPETRRERRPSSGESRPALSKSDGLLTCTWDFGDGNTSQEANPLHVYRSTGDFEVSLTVRNDLGFEDTYRATVTVGSDDAEKISIEWELQEETNLLDPDAESLKAVLVCNLISVVPRELTVRSWTTSPGGVTEHEQETITAKPREVVQKEITIPVGKDSFVINWEMCSEGIPILKRGLRVVRDTDRMPRVTLENASVVDEEGNHVVVKLTSKPNRERRKFRDVFDPEKDDVLRIALADNSLCELNESVSKERQSGLYFNRLESMLKKEYPSTRIIVKRFEHGNPGLGYTPVKRLIELAHDIEEFNPDVILVSLDSKDAETFRMDRLTRYYAFQIHNFIANTGAKIILVSPPPDCWKTYRSKIYANMISELSIVHSVGLADAFQSVSLYEGDWKELYAVAENAKSKYLNSEGQGIVADTIFEAIIKD